MSTDKWARVSWLLCCVPVPPLSGIFGIDSPTKMGSTILPARVGWLLYVVSILSLGSLGLIPKFFFIPSQTFPNDRKHNFVPQGWMVATSKLCPSSLSGIFEIDSPKQMGSTSLPARVGLLLCCVQIMISKYMEAWTIQVQISKSFGCYDVFFLYLVRLTIPFHR